MVNEKELSCIKWGYSKNIGELVLFKNKLNVYKTTSPLSFILPSNTRDKLLCSINLSDIKHITFNKKLLGRKIEIYLNPEAYKKIYDEVKSQSGALSFIVDMFINSESKLTYHVNKIPSEKAREFVDLVDKLIKR